MAVIFTVLSALLISISIRNNFVADCIKYYSQVISSDGKFVEWSHDFPSPARIEYRGKRNINFRGTCKFAEGCYANRTSKYVQVCVQRNHKQCIFIGPSLLRRGALEITDEFFMEVYYVHSTRSVILTFRNQPPQEDILDFTITCFSRVHVMYLTSNPLQILDLRAIFPKKRIDISPMGVFLEGGSHYPCISEKISRQLHDMKIRPTINITVEWYICKTKIFDDCFTTRVKLSEFQDFKSWPIQVGLHGMLRLPYVEEDFQNVIINHYLFCTIDGFNITFYDVQLTAQWRGEPKKLPWPTNRDIEVFNSTTTVIFVPCVFEADQKDKIKSVKWTYKGNKTFDLRPGDFHEDIRVSVANDSSNILFRGPFPDNFNTEGQYTCTVTSETDKTKTCTYNLKLLAPTSGITTMTTRKFAFVDHNFTHSCRFKNNKRITSSKITFYGHELVREHPAKMHSMLSKMFGPYMKNVPNMQLRHVNTEADGLMKTLYHNVSLSNGDDICYTFSCVASTGFLETTQTITVKILRIPDGIFEDYKKLMEERCPSNNTACNYTCGVGGNVALETIRADKDSLIQVFQQQAIKQYVWNSPPHTMNVTEDDLVCRFDFGLEQIGITADYYYDVFNGSASEFVDIGDHLIIPFYIVPFFVVITALTGIAILVFFLLP